jgi:para-aminobenzoate synthetase component 1
MYERGFYTGICGHFNGETLDTGVMIRFIKRENNQLYYCSGGGITSFSDPEKEYQEMVDKIYLPF